MKNFKLLIVSLVCCIALTYIIKLRAYEYPSATFDGKQKETLSAIFDLFLQKTGGTMSGNLVLGTAGNGVQIKEGSNARMGQLTLASGAAIVSNTSITSNTRVFLSRSSVFGTAGHLDVSSRTSGVNFRVRSSSSGDESVINYLLIESP